VKGPAGRWAWAAGFVALLAGAWLSMGAPQLTVLNTGLRVTYPWPRGAGALLAAAGALGLAAASRRFWLRLPAAALAAASLWTGLHLLRYRIETDPGGLTARGAWGQRRVAWPSLTQVESGPGLVVLRSGSEALRLDVADLRAEDRATLDRTIARRVRETSPP
jgi:hypothetical protein